MRLNHLDLHVPDVAATRDFFVAYFGLRPVETRGADGLAILNDDAGLELVLSHPVEKFGGADQALLGVSTYHIGFMLPSREEVDRLHERLRRDHTTLVGELRSIRGGWLFYCTAPGHILVEVGWRP